MPRRSIRSSTVASTRSARSPGAGDGAEEASSKHGRSRGRPAKQDIEIEETSIEETPAKRKRGKQSAAPDPSPQKRPTRGAVLEDDSSKRLTRGAMQDDSSRSRSNTRKEKDSPAPSARGRRSLSSKKVEKEEPEESEEDEVEEKEQKTTSKTPQKGKKASKKKEEQKETSPSPSKRKSRTPGKDATPSRSKRGAKSQEPVEAAVTPRGRRGQKAEQQEAEDSHSVDESAESEEVMGRVRKSRGQKSDQSQETKPTTPSPRGRGRKAKVVEEAVTKESEKVSPKKPQKEKASPQNKKKITKPDESVEDESKEAVCEKSPVSKKVIEKKTTPKRGIKEPQEDSSPSRGRRKRESDASESKGETAMSRSRRSKESSSLEPSPKRSRGRRSDEKTKSANDESTLDQNEPRKDATQSIDDNDKTRKIETQDEKKEDIELKGNESASEEKTTIETVENSTSDVKKDDQLEEITETEDGRQEEPMEDDVIDEKVHEIEPDEKSEESASVDITEKNEKSETISSETGLPTEKSAALADLAEHEDDTKDSSHVDDKITVEDGTKHTVDADFVETHQKVEVCENTSKGTETYQQLQTEEISDEDMDTDGDYLGAEQTETTKEINDDIKVSDEKNTVCIEEKVTLGEAKTSVKVDESSSESHKESLETTEQASAETQEEAKQIEAVEVSIHEENLEGTDKEASETPGVKQTEGVDDVSLHKESSETIEHISSETKQIETFEDEPSQESSDDQASKEAPEVESIEAVEDVSLTEKLEAIDQTTSEEQEKEEVEDVSLHENLEAANQTTSGAQEIKQVEAVEDEPSHDESLGATGNASTNTQAGDQEEISVTPHTDHAVASTITTEQENEAPQHTDDVEDISAEEEESPPEITQSHAEEKISDLIEVDKPLNDVDEITTGEDNLPEAMEQGSSESQLSYQEVSDDSQPINEAATGDLSSGVEVQSFEDNVNKPAVSQEFQEISDDDVIPDVPCQDTAESTSLPASNSSSNTLLTVSEPSIAVANTNLNKDDSPPLSSPRKRKHDEIDAEGDYNPEDDEYEDDYDNPHKKLRSEPIELQANGEVDSSQQVAMEAQSQEIPVCAQLTNECEKPDSDHQSSDIVTERFESSKPQTFEHNPQDVLFSRKYISNPNFLGAKDTFSVASYNILAESHVRPTDYSYTPDEFLSMDYRHSLLLKELKYLDADILCLQEVEEDYHTCLDKELRAHGYVGLFKKRTLDYYKEGDCTYYKTSRFSLEEQNTYSLTELISKDIDEYGLDHDTANAVKEYLNRADVLVVSKLKCQATGKILTVGNTHIVFGLKKIPDVQCIQISSVIKKVVASAGGEQNPHIICGDFNSEVTDPGYQLVCEGYLSDETIQHLQSIENVNFPDGKKTSLINHMWEAFQHSSNLKSSYKEVLGQEPGISTFTSFMCCTVDYIFYNSGCLDVSSVLETIDKETVLKTNGLPNKIFPSDHVSLKTVFSFK